MRSLVTSSGQRHRLLQRVLDRPGLFGLISYAAALYYASFILDYRNAEHTRISEHALMPGLVTERFDKDGLAAEYLQGLREHVNSKQDYICKCLLDAGLSCHKQRWWSTVRVTNASGTNVYAVLRAPRATGVEAMLFAVDLTQREAAAMVMAYAAFARQQVYWARDLFFVFVDGGAPGMDAWLSEYHLVEDNALRGDALPEMGGVMIGGVVMKSQATKSTKDPVVRIELNHLNGQLPNLDLFNSVVRIAGKGKFALHSTVYGVRDIEQKGCGALYMELEACSSFVIDHLAKLTNRRVRPLRPSQGGSDWHMLVPLRAMYTQAFVAVEGIHSVMGKYGVQAVTVAVPPLVSYPLRHSTRLLEAIARSLNNVLERFHQSYFLYILASTDNFVSIAYFMPIIGGILLPLLMFAYRDWTYLTSLTVPRTWLVMHVIGLCTWMISTKYFAEYGENAKNDVIFLGMSTLVPWGLIIPTPVTEIQSLRFFLLLECSLSAAAVSLLNFSLALCFALVAVPVLIKFTQDNEKRPRALLRTALALACHPAGIYALFLVYGRPYLGYGGKAVSLGVDTFTNALLRLVKEHLVYGSHVLPLLLVLVLPMWNLVLPLALVRLKLVQHTVTEGQETVGVPKDKDE